MEIAEGIQGIPCSHYEGGEGDFRVGTVLGYAAGYLGDQAINESVAKIVRLHDHKGELFVVTREELSPYLREAIRRGWSDMGYEPPENVSFADVNSADWDMIWNSKRYKSDWET